RGAATGIALHAVLEHVDFRQPAALHSLVDQYFAPLLLDDDLHGAVREQLVMLLKHPLPAADRVVRLAEVGPDDRINEAEFYYPVRSFTTRELATVCKADNASSLPNTIERLQFDPLDGYLRGFMDLVFRHQGRYYLADWKSNWLGNSTEDYAPQRLDRAMADNFYHLQSWLYALALQRFLASRLPDYQYEQHFGGIFYIFVRGLDPAVAERGVHFERPTRNFLQNLGDVVFGDGGNDER
ncbi:MAG: exodeoxyribonuclease V subunit beta, partial [Gammaproteobacteria bacterium]|nr:exodeoxyribonuclease V subunit beta [Gammaproteobacteria bacterium]